jgi:hypothetical protein
LVYFRIILAITKEFAKEEVDKETHLTLPKDLTEMKRENNTNNNHKIYLLNMDLTLGKKLKEIREGKKDESASAYVHIHN